MSQIMTENPDEVNQLQNDYSKYFFRFEWNNLWHNDNIANYGDNKTTNKWLRVSVRQNTREISNENHSYQIGRSLL